MNQLVHLPNAAGDLATEHLQAEHWARANRLLVKKALAEFSHEKLLSPEPLGNCCYRVAVPDSSTEYRFKARRLALDHWSIVTDSIEKLNDGLQQPLDALSFIIEFADTLGISENNLPVYLDEISSTLFGSAYKLANSPLSAAQLALADFQQIETGMREGHPGFVANNGRMGFDVQDYRAYAPEAASPVRLVWLAVHRSRASYSAIDGLDQPTLLREELGGQLEVFHSQLRALQLDPDDYLLMPAHPWQWHNILAIGFAAEIANRQIVHLGLSNDRYLAQQSIRTFFNQSQPQRRYVKTALSILNMGFMRGLSPYYMQATPAINAYLAERVASDPQLRDCGFQLLREVAAIGYRNPYYEQALPASSPYRKMLSALWRESPHGHIQPGQRLMTMAALLHSDGDERALLATLISASGVTADRWLRRYLNAYLTPLLHCFYAHDLVFMPHGENLILVLEDHLPVRVLMKDIGEEAVILDAEAQIPEAVGRLAVSVPDELKVLSIFTDVFDGFFRYLSQILDEQVGLPEQRFWQQVADCIADYQASQPQLRDKFARYDLFAEEFARSCLNRLQLGNNRQMLDLADPAGALKFAGTLKNPVAPYAPER